MKRIISPATIVTLLWASLSFIGCSGSDSSEKAPVSAAAEETASTEVPAKSQVTAEPFSKTLSLQGITFAVNATPDGKLTITPSGLENDNEPWEHEIEGKVTGAEVEDLNSDGSPEVLVYTSSGGNNYGNVIGYSVNNKKSMSQIYFPDLRDNPEASQGYEGHDEFAIVETTLARRFPVYENGQATGTTRQIQYKLVNGENSRIFNIDKIVEY